MLPQESEANAPGPCLLAYSWHTASNISPNNDDGRRAADTEKLWKESIQKKVEGSGHGRRHQVQGKKAPSSNQAAKKVLSPDSIDAYDLEEALAETIWESFVLEEIGECESAFNQQDPQQPHGRYDEPDEEQAEESECWMLQVL